MAAHSQQATTCTRRARRRCRRGARSSSTRTSAWLFRREPVRSPNQSSLYSPLNTWEITNTSIIPIDGRIAPRSGLASKNFIDTGAGVIDADYRGPVKVLLFNHSDADFAVKEGDRVAQLVLERIYTPDVLEVQELEESVRGAGGFGSTGVN